MAAAGLLNEESIEQQFVSRHDQQFHGLPFRLLRQCQSAGYIQYIIHADHVQ